MFSLLTTTLQKAWSHLAVQPRKSFRSPELPGSEIQREAAVRLAQTFALVTASNPH